MKIICTKAEFAELVRSCMFSSYQEECSGCVFSFFCAQGGQMTEGDLMQRIEDVCEIGDEDDG